MSGPIESIHAYELDPAVTTWQAALAASQQDLTRAEAQRDEARTEAREWRATAELYLEQRDAALHDLAVANRRLSLPTQAKPTEETTT